MAEALITVAAASRPYPGETANGDAWAVDWHDGCCRIAMIDGLGHGPQAAAAAQAACAALHARPDLRPEDALRHCHQALLGTRGAVMAVAWIDPAAKELTYAGLGNVEARLWRAGHSEQIISARGYAGGILRTVRAQRYTLNPQWALAMYTDGLLSHLEFPEAPVLHTTDLPPLANDLLSTWARPTDDATLLIARPAPVAAPLPAPSGALP